jgi:hypothetical protein
LDDFYQPKENTIYYLCRFMRKVFAIGLSVIIVTQAFYNAGVTAYWLANRAYIASALCENRDKPQSHCNGKCYLKKKLAQSPDNQATNNTSKSLVLKKGIELAEPLPEQPVFPAFTVHTPKPVIIPSIPYYVSSLYAAGVFHPPC